MKQHEKDQLPTFEISPPQPSKCISVYDIRKMSLQTFLMANKIEEENKNDNDDDSAESSHQFTI